jgi:hypothetical protein
LRPIAFATLLVACSENEVAFHPAAALGGDASITGRICDPDTQTWLEGALAYTYLTDEDGVVLDTREGTSDADGRWTLEDLPNDAEYDVWVQYGNEVLNYMVVPVDQGSTEVQLPDPPCFAQGDATVAVISGGWDDLSSMLPDFGFPDLTIVNGQAGDELVEFLTNPDALAGYDMLFFDGGHLEDGIFYGGNGDGTVTAVKENVAAYVDAGGRLFATDWAYDVVERIWPDHIDFYGDDGVPDAAQVGEPGTVKATLVDPGLALLAGGGTAGSTSVIERRAPVRTRSIVPSSLSARNGWTPVSIS